MPSSTSAFNAEAELWKATAKSAQALAVRWKDERDRAIETRENANAVSVRVEAENRRLREALEEALDYVPDYFIDKWDLRAPLESRDA